MIFNEYDNHFLVGSTWDTKVRRCGALIHKYIKKASRPFQSLHNRATFFNTEIPQSTVHSLACHFGYVCVENIQIYSLLSKYLHDITVNIRSKQISSFINVLHLTGMSCQDFKVENSSFIIRTSFALNYFDKGEFHFFVIFVANFQNYLM